MNSTPVICIIVRFSHPHFVSTRCWLISSCLKYSSAEWLHLSYSVRRMSCRPVLPLLLRKSLDLMIENTRFIKNTRLRMRYRFVRLQGNWCCTIRTGGCYVFICLSQTSWSLERTRAHTHKRLFLYASNSFNTTWSATPFHMVSYHRE